MIKVYIYRKSNGLYKYEHLGSPDSVIDNLGDDLDFTLTPKPADGKPYKWNGKEWEAVDADS